VSFRTALSSFLRPIFCGERRPSVMSQPADESPVPGDHRLLRLPAPPKDFVPENWRPSWLELNPSTEDKRHAEATGRPVRVSVWDASLTTPEQALAFRGRQTIIIGGTVAAVITGGATGVVYDRLSHPDIERPGAFGHAGIEGLVRPEGEPKLQWRERLQRVAEAFALDTAA
jgi:hypothetical protein